jgi:LacI family transcriptional regulator
MVCESGGEQERELKLLDVLEDKKIDGVLFAGVNINQTLVDTIKKKDYPVVLVTQETSVGPNVMNTVIHDNIQASYDAVNFLIDNGHNKIAYLGGPKHDFSNGEKRLKGYKKALEKAGIEILDSYIIQGDFSFQFGYDGMKKLYEENRILPTAVMAGSDLIAVGAIQFLYTVGMKVPDEMSIIGFDDLEFTTYFKPELSTIRIPYFEEGERAAKELLRLMEGEKVEPATHYVPHKIIRRNTVKYYK